MKVKTFTLLEKSRISQYRLCEIVPTICGINGVSYTEVSQPLLVRSNCLCTCSTKKITRSSHSKWTVQDRVRSYSQVIQRPPRKSTKILTQVNSQTPPKYLSLRITARKWCAYQNNKILYAVNETIKCEVGCLTKLMVIYTAISLIDNLKQKIIVPYFVEGLPLPKADLNPYNYLTLEDLLYAIILRGANDAIWTIVTYIVENFHGIQQRNLIRNKFLQLMNQNANRLMMTNTRYTNIEGLEDPNNITTAYDLCLLCDKLLSYEIIRKIIKSKSYTCRAQFEDGKFSTCYSWKSRQLSLLKKGFSGIMNGNNSNSGPCSVVLHNDKEKNTNMIIVLLKCNPKMESTDAQLITKYQ